MTHKHVTRCTSGGLTRLITAFDYVNPTSYAAGKFGVSFPLLTIANRVHTTTLLLAFGLEGGRLGVPCTVFVNPVRPFLEFWKRCNFYLCCDVTHYSFLGGSCNINIFIVIISIIIIIIIQ
jgi:hypothetical protein